MKRLMKTAIGMVIVTGCPAMIANDYDFNGWFTKDNDIALYSFTLDTSSQVTVFTSSGAQGGFDPIIGIWKSDGTYLDERDDGRANGTLESNGASYTLSLEDSFYQANLGAGRYLVSIAQYDNFSWAPFMRGLLQDGFAHDNQPHFTRSFLQPDAIADFNTLLGEPRESFYTFHVVNVAKAAAYRVPDSGATALLLGTALAGCAWIARRRSP